MKSTNFSLKKLLIIILIGMLVWSVGAKYTSSHEEIHKHIFEHYNIESNISINYLTLNGATTPNSYDNCSEMCLFSHELNDIIGYNVSLIIYFITNLTLIIFALKKWN
jgi:hypothetical protein